jgi:carboxyl-terminal processing protease
LPRSSPLRDPDHSIKAFGLVLLIWLIPSFASADPTKLRQRAADCEKRGAWLEACRCYDEILRKDRTNSSARDGYQRCLRRLHVVSRHGDPVYRHTLEKLTPAQALDAYEQVISLLSVAYPDRAKTNLGLLFQQGLHELRLALDDPGFRKHHLPGVKPAAINAFKNRLASWPERRIATRAEARDQVSLVLRSARRDGIALRPKQACAFALEFAAGACNALDDYSSFLTPGNLATAQTGIRGKVGVGVELGAGEGGVQVARIYPQGPAQEAGLKKTDRLLRIAGKAVANLDAAAERLLGEPGSTVEIEVLSAGEPDRNKRIIKLVRRAVTVPSVELEPIDLGQSVIAGYLRISYFSDSTMQDIKDRLVEARQMSSTAPKGLIIDLRGNPGGLFKSAVNVAEMFLTEGVIVISQSPFKEYNGAFKVESSGPFQFPVVVLIDGETASAAEVLAGALQGRPNTRVMGQTSYGKGSIQCVIPLEKVPFDRPAGIRLTVAKLFSPTNQPYTGRGVIPAEATTVQGEALLDEAKKELRLMLLPMVAMNMEP